MPNVLLYLMHLHRRSRIPETSETLEAQIEENPLHEENKRIIGILDMDRSMNPCIKRLKQLCTTNGFAIRTEFIVDFVSRMHRDRKIEAPEMHRLLILIESAAAM